MGIKRTFIRNTSLNVISYIYLAIAAIISIPMLVRYLGIESFGLYTIITSVMPILSSLDFGLGLAVVRYLALPGVSEENKTKAWQTSFFFFGLVGSCLALITAVVFYTYIFKISSFDQIFKSDKYLLMLVVSLTILVSHLNTHFLTLPQARHRFDIFSLNAFITGTASTFVSAWVASIWPDLLMVFITQLVGVSITVVILFFYANSQFPSKNFPMINLDIFRNLIGFGLRSFAGKVMGAIEANSMNFVIAAMVSVQAVTYFSIPQSLIVRAAGGISMLTLSLFPLSASLLSKDGFPKLKKLIIWLQATVTAGIFFGLAVIFFLGRPLLGIWLDDPVLVDQVLPLLQVMSVQLFFTAMTPMPTAVLESMNYPGITSFFALLTVILDFVFLFILLPIFGITGAAYALSLSAMITVPIFFVVFLKKFRNFEFRLTLAEQS